MRQSSRANAPGRQADVPANISDRSRQSEPVKTGSDTVNPEAYGVMILFFFSVSGILLK